MVARLEALGGEVARGCRRARARRSRPRHRPGRRRRPGWGCPRARRASPPRRRSGPPRRPSRRPPAASCARAARPSARPGPWRSACPAASARPAAARSRRSRPGAPRRRRARCRRCRRDSPRLVRAARTAVGVVSEHSWVDHAAEPNDVGRVGFANGPCPRLRHVPRLGLPNSPTDRSSAVTVPASTEQRTRHATTARQALARPGRARLLVDEIDTGRSVDQADVELADRHGTPLLGLSARFATRGRRARGADRDPRRRDPRHRRHRAVLRPARARRARAGRRPRGRRGGAGDRGRPADRHARERSD